MIDMVITSPSQSSLPPYIDSSSSSPASSSSNTTTTNITHRLLRPQKIRRTKTSTTKMVIFAKHTTILVTVVAAVVAAAALGIVDGFVVNTSHCSFTRSLSCTPASNYNLQNSSRKPITYPSRLMTATATATTTTARRSSPKTTVEADNENGANKVVSNGNSNNDASQSQQQQPECPFSTVIPRYQIELSSSPLKRQRQRQRSRTTDKRSKKGSSNSLITNGGDIQKKISNTITDIIKVPSKFFRTVTKAAQQQQLQKIPLRPGESLRILEDDDKTIASSNDFTNASDEIRAMSFLWQAAAELIDETRTERKSEIETSSNNNLPPSSSPSSSSRSIVLALPGCSLDLVVNFVEIIEWISSFNDDKLLSPFGDDKIHAELLQANRNGGANDLSSSSSTTTTIPVIRIRMEGERQVRETSSPPPSKSRRQQVSDAADLDSDIINERTRHWVRRLLVDERICPFTRSDKMSGQGLGELGVPVGSIAYHTSKAQHPIRLFADTWTAIQQMIEAGPEGRTGVSSILLAAPFYDDDFDTWAGPIFAVLEASVVAADAEKDIGVVCFHPRYATPDGSTFPGFGQMHSVPRLAKWCREYANDNYNKNSNVGRSSSYNDTERGDSTRILDNDEVAAGGAWQRRTPHATINVLRADQLAIAESRRESEILYPRNIERLVVDIGSDQLAVDLEKERQMGKNKILF